jgi:lipopolysaccharide biosynthesis glycosyltransferase
MKKGAIMINILFGGNEKVFDGILLCLMSMTKNTNSAISVYILTADVTELNEEYKPITKNQAQALKSVLRSKNPNSNVFLIQLNKDFNDWITNSSNKLSSYTPFAFLRLFADKIETLPEKIIYLDTDIMLNGNIEDLFNIDISNHELGVVLDRYGKFFIKPNYFNSGMLLMNMKKIKETNLLEKVRNFCFNKKMAFPDQSALNKLCKKKLFLPRKFNEQGKLKNDTVIQHFSKRIKWFPFFHTINIKPWQIEEVQNIYNCNAYDDIYEEYKKTN